MTGIAPLISSTPYRRIRSRVAIRDQFIRPIRHFLSTRVVTAKPPGKKKTDGFALAPQTMQAAFRTTGIVGAVEPGEQREATRFVPRHAQ